MGALSVVLAGMSVSASANAPVQALASVQFAGSSLRAPVDLFPEVSAESVGLHLPVLSPADYMEIYSDQGGR